MSPRIAATQSPLPISSGIETIGDLQALKTALMTQSPLPISSGIETHGFFPSGLMAG